MRGISMSLHIPASQLPHKEILFTASPASGEAIDALKRRLLIFGVLVLVSLDLFANWWMGGTP
jgi:hypothetical protein